MIKNVLVVGGASGIGRETVNAYLNRGHNVVVFDINKDYLNLMQKSNFSEENVIYINGDVRNKEDIEYALEQSTKRFGDIDIMVYSAAIFPDHKFLEMKESDWDKVININLRGAFLFGQKVAKNMVVNKIEGHIIMISSGSYRSARVGSSHYCASKSGLVMLTKCMAMELAPYNISVNSVAPGLIENPILDESYKMNFKKRIPAGRLGKPTEVSNLILMLTELNNSYLTGQVIGIDGALSTGQYGLGMSNKAF